MQNCHYLVLQKMFLSALKIHRLLMMKMSSVLCQSTVAWCYCVVKPPLEIALSLLATQVTRSSRDWHFVGEILFYENLPKRYLFCFVLTFCLNVWMCDVKIEKFGWEIMPRLHLSLLELWWAFFFLIGTNVFVWLWWPVSLKLMKVIKLVSVRKWWRNLRRILLRSKKRL